MDSSLRCYVYPFLTPNSHYLYDATTNSIIKTNKGIYTHFKNDVQLNDEDRAILTKMSASGYFSGDKIQCIEQPYTSILDKILEQKILGITLQVTQQCNLRCHYCVYSGAYEGRTHTNKRMTFETARQGIDFLLSRSSGLEKIIVSFYGGEPLLGFNLIKQVVSYTKEHSVGKKIQWMMTTNGTLFTDENLAFLQENEFNLLISLDGPKEIHDKNRVFASSGKGTFDVIIKNIDHIKSHYKKLYETMLINAVIDQSLDPACSNTFFMKLSNFNIMTSPVNPDYRKEPLDISEQYFINDSVEWFRSFLGQLGRINKKNISHLAQEKFNHLKSKMFTLRDRCSGLPKTVHHGGPCIPGAHKLFLNTEGDLYPCEKVSENSKATRIGNLSEGFDIGQVRKIFNLGKLTEEECKNCWAIRLCDQCLIAAEDGGSLSRRRKLSSCEQTHNQIDNMLKSYVTLIEYGYVFEDDDPILTL